MAYSASNTSDLRRDAQQGAREAANDLAGKAADLADKASKHFDSAVEGAEAAAREFAGQGREAGEHISEVAGNLKTAVDKSLKDQPLTTLAMAAAAGFVIGALWKS
ncbi:MAG: hypothetical protein R3D51_07035 [Hyphomicrobiaceae bacterium]